MGVVASLSVAGASPVLARQPLAAYVPHLEIVVADDAAGCNRENLRHLMDVQRSLPDGMQAIGAVAGLASGKQHLLGIPMPAVATLDRHYLWRIAGKNKLEHNYIKSQVPPVALLAGAPLVPGWQHLAAPAADVFVGAA